jgi:uncharacterized protein YecT (DUF1311 family)
MMTDIKLSVLIAAAFMFISSELMATSTAQNDYSHFTPSKTQIEQMSNATDAACHAKAESASNLNSNMACIDSTYKRIDKRLNKSYRTAMRRISKAKKEQLRLEQKSWLDTGFNYCEEKWKEELNVEGVTYRYEVRKCSLAELHRRTLWVEQYR